MKYRAIDPSKSEMADALDRWGAHHHADLLRGHTVYVSSAKGDDSNDGLSIDRPKRTIDAAKNVMRDGHHDWMILRPGETYEAIEPASRMLGEVLIVLILVALATGLLALGLWSFA